MIQLHVINESKLSNIDVQTAILACQNQWDRDIAPAWGTYARIHFVPPGSKAIGPNVVHVVDESPIGGTDGYHEYKDAPTGYVGIASARNDGVPWTAVLSHELGELGLDLEAARCFLFNDELLALEPFDAVEGQTYKRLGIDIQNFVYPAYFIPGSKGPWDYMGLLSGPYPALAPAGYMLRSQAGTWDQINAAGVRAAKRIAAAGSRRARRMRRR